jgi:branched-chain amino acid transport system substrate-binding protein
MQKLIALLALAAIAGSGVPAGAQSVPYTLPVILPMTGQAAFSGQAESQSLAAYEKYVNANGGVRGVPIHFDIHDDQTSPQVALQLANAEIAQHVPVIFGSAPRLPQRVRCSSVCRPVTRRSRTRMPLRPAPRSWR